MAAVTNNLHRSLEENVKLAKVDMAATGHVYRGTPCSFPAAGGVDTLTAGEKFAGFPEREVDNSAGLAGDLQADLKLETYPKLTVVGVSALTDVGRKVYALDNNSYTLVPGAPGASTLIGTVHRHISTTSCIVHALAGMDDDIALQELITPVVEATAGVHTITAAELLSGLYLRDCAGGARTDTTVTATVLIAALKDARVGSSFRFIVENTSDAAETLTIAGGTDVTISGTATIAQSNSKEFIGYVTNVGTPAVTLRSLGTSTT